MIYLTFMVLTGVVGICAWKWGYMEGHADGHTTGRMDTLRIVQRGIFRIESEREQPHWISGRASHNGREVRVCSKCDRAVCDEGEHERECWE